MKKLNDEIVNFLSKQGYVIISTIGQNGYPNNSCKDIVEIDKDGRIYLLDLFRGRTQENLKLNPNVSITAIDEHRFVGYSLEGKAHIVAKDEKRPHLLKAWEDKITDRLSRRLIKNLHGEKGHSKHPEAMLPKPEYMIAVNVEEIVDLTPRKIKEGSG